MEMEDFKKYVMRIYPKKIFSIATVLGVSLISLGIIVINNPKFTTARFQGVYIDLTGFNVPFGVAVIIFGLLFIFFELTKDRSKEIDKYLVCPKCQTPYKKSKIQIYECPNCKVPLEDLKGFHDRHPD